MHTIFSRACGGALMLMVSPFLAGAARADDTSATDFHCMVIGSVMSNAQNAELKNAGLFMTLYYLGRLDGSGKSVDFKSSYNAEMDKLPKADLQAEATKCSALLTTRGAELARISQDMAPPANAATAAPTAPEKQNPVKPAP